jgi:hypothetical protein
MSFILRALSKIRNRLIGIFENVSRLEKFTGILLRKKIMNWGKDEHCKEDLVVKTSFETRLNDSLNNY